MSLSQERDFVGHGEGFFLVVGDIDGGDPGVFADVADLESEVVAEFGVEVGEGFVEEEDGGFDDYCSRQSDALLLSA